MNTEYKKVRAFVQQIRLKLTLRILRNEISLLLAAFFLFSSVLNFTFSLFPWIVLPPAWDMSVVAVLLLVIWKVLDHFFIRSMKLGDVARLVEKRSGKHHLLLSISLELDNKTESSPFVVETHKRAAEQLKQISISNTFPPLPRLPEMLSGASFLIWAITLLLLKPALIEYWNLPLSLLKERKVTIFPGTVRVPVGNDVTIRLIQENNTLPSARLTIYSNGGLRTNDFLLRADTNGAFHYDLDSIQESIVYKFSFGGRVFAAESINLILPPMLLGLTVTVDPPSYTGMKKIDITDGMGDVSVAAGSKLTFNIISSELTKAGLLINDDTLEMDIHKDTAILKIVAKENANYTFALKNSYGMSNDSLPIFHIEIIADELPYVHIVKPGYDKVISPEQRETLWVEGVDDFGIRSMELIWFSSGNGEVSGKKVDIEKDAKEARNEVIWDLKENLLYPGDTLFYFVKLRDNYPYSVHEVISDTFSFRLPGFEEIHKSVVENGEYASEKIAQTRNRQDEISDKLEELIKGKESKDGLTWQQEKILDEVKQEVDAQADSLQNALQSLQESVENLRKEGVLNNDINNKMDEIRKALEDLIAQFGDSLLNLDKNRQEISYNEMKDAIEKAQEMLPELNERLDNTLKFLELLKKDHELAMFAMQSEKLAKEQLELMEKRNENQILEKQKSLQNRIGTFSKSLKEKKFDNAQLNSALHEVDDKNKLMQSETDDGNVPKSGSMSEMGSALMDVTQKIKAGMSSAKQKQMEALKDNLLKMAGDLFNLMQWKAQISNDIYNKSDQEIALSQQAFIESIQRSRQRLDSLSALPPVMQQSLREDYELLSQMSHQALQAVSGSGLSYSMRFIEQGLLNLQNSVISIIESMSQQGSQSESQGGNGDLMSQLRGLSGKQGAINSAVSEMLRSMMSGKAGQNGKEGGQSGNSAAQEKARSDAENAQRALADQLDMLAKKFKGQGDGSGGAMGKRMEELEKEAQKLAEMLRNPPTQEVKDRQDKFLSRMLQTALSMHQQGEGKDERKSKSAKNVFAKKNEELSMDKIQKDSDAYYNMRRKALQGNFPQEYRGAIKTYFDSLGVLFLKKGK